jgi:hypothetical protein
LIDLGGREKDREILAYRWPCKLNGSSECGKAFFVSAIKLRSYVLSNMHSRAFVSFFCSFHFSFGICSQGFVKLYCFFPENKKKPETMKSVAFLIL